MRVPGTDSDGDGGNDGYGNGGDDGDDGGNGYDNGGYDNGGR